MKYVQFKANDMKMYGVLENETITELDGNFLLDSAKKTSNTYRLSEVELLPPIKPGQIVAIGLNYALHAEESGKAIPEEPMMFMISPSAIIGNEDFINLKNLHHRIDYEGELAVVIGREAKNIRKEDAFSYVFGYTVCNDVSDRDLQKKDGQFTRAKSFATYKPIGPVIETELDPNNVEIKLTVNGEVRQHSNTNDFIHNVQSLIEAITEVMTLHPGDIIITGTPSGVGPLQAGDQVEIEIEGIGTLMNKVSHQS